MQPLKTSPDCVALHKTKFYPSDRAPYGLCDQATLATSSRGVLYLLPSQSQLPVSLMHLNDYMCTHTTMDWWLSMVCWDFLSTWWINHCELVTLPHLKTDLLINLLWTGRELACKLAIRSFTIGLTVVVHPLLTSSEWCWSMHDHQRCRLVVSSMCFNPQFPRLLTVGDFIKPHKSNLFL